MFFALVANAFAGPALVTAARGDISVVAGDAESSPAAPYVLDESHALRVPAGATAVVLFEGRAVQITGPALVRIGDLEGAGAVTGQDPNVLAELVRRGSSAKPVGATRAGGTSLSRPIAGDKVARVQSIAWSCEDCGEQTVTLTSFLDDEVVWTGQGADRVAYDGPALEPGPYALSVGGSEFSFRVEDPSQVEAAREAGGALPGDPILDAMVQSGVLAAGGYWSEALWTLDAAIEEHGPEADLVSLRQSFEARAGL